MTESNSPPIKGYAGIVPTPLFGCDSLERENISNKVISRSSHMNPTHVMDSLSKTLFPLSPNRNNNSCDVIQNMKSNDDDYSPVSYASGVCMEDVDSKQSNSSLFNSSSSTSFGIAASSRQGSIESVAVSFDSNDSNNNNNNKSTTSHYTVPPPPPIPQCNSNFEESLVCTAKMRRLNFDSKRSTVYKTNMESDELSNNQKLYYQKVEEGAPQMKPVGFISPTEVSDLHLENNDPMIVSDFSSPPITKRKTFTPNSYSNDLNPPWEKDIPKAAPMLKRKARVSLTQQDQQHNSSSKKEELKSRLLHDFDTLDTLGDGCFGTVYKCRSRIDKCLYAVKVIKFQAKSISNRNRMLKEVYALAALSNSTDTTAAFHIVRYYQAWMEENRLFIQTELCTSTLLDEMKQNKGFDLKRQFMVLRQMLLALDLIHRNSMVHLDIKPENIFIKNNDQFKLGDFGLASIIKNSTMYGDVEEGDAKYICIDLLQGNHEDLTKCDIFSLGATMYEIALRRPLPASGVEWQDIREGKLCPLPHASHELSIIIKSMMHPQIKERPSAAQLLKKRELLSADEKQLISERNKANMALAQLSKLKSPKNRKLLLRRASTLS